MKALHLILLLGISLFFNVAVAADVDIDKGWEYFAANDLENAKKSFTKALSGPDKAQAHLGLSIVATSTDNITEADEHYLEFFKTSDDPYPTIEALWSMGGGEQSEIRLELLQAIAEGGSEKLKVWANQALGFHYKAIDDLKTSNRYFDKTITVETWQVVGEFENISESGFNGDFGPIANPQENSVFKNKRGVDVKWFDLPMVKASNWVDFQYHFYVKNSIIYAQTFCQSPEDREVQFRLGTSGSAKVWVNDKLMFVEAKERNNGADTYVFTAKLLKGNNRILVQIGASEIDRSNFLLRITDEKGVSYTDMNYSTKYQEYPTTTYDYTSKVIENDVEQKLLKVLEADPNKLNSYLPLIQMYLYQDKVFKANQILKEAKKRFPDCSYITTLLIDSYIRDGNSNGITTNLEELKEKDPNGALSQEFLFEEAYDLEDYDKANKILADIEKRSGLSSNVYNKKIKIASARSETENVLKLANDAYNKYPDDPEFVILKYTILKKVKKDVKGAIKVLTQYLKNHFNDEISLKLVSEYFSAGDISNGLKVYQHVLEHYPMATGYYSNLASIYYSMGDYAKSEEMYEKCLKIAPYVGSYHATLGKTYAEMNKPDQAKEAYETAIKFDPYDYDTRELLHNLLEKENIFSNFEGEDVYEVFKNSPGADAYPEDNSVFLVDEVERVIYSGGGSEERHVLLVKVFNTDGVDRWKEFNIYVGNNQQGLVEHAEVLKKNGSKLEAQRNGAHVVFPNLEPGDAIHISYRLKNYYSGKLTDHFWDKFYLNTYYPEALARYSLMVPKGREFSYKVSNSDLKPVITEKDEFTMYTWEVKDQPAIKSEAYMPKLVDVGQVLHISSFKSWDYIAEWYTELSNSKAKEDFELLEAAEELFAGKGSLSDREKVQLIYEYIVTNIRYSSVSFLQSGLIPQKASRVISSKQGDCKDVSTLFVALCKTQGIDANLVLVNTRGNGQNDLILPSIDFNHCIAKVELDGKEYYVEMTSDNLPFSSGYSSIKRTFALDIPREKAPEVVAGVIDPDTRVRNDVKRETTMTFNGNNVLVSRLNWRSGILAAGIRGKYKNEGKETQFKYMQESVSSIYPNLSLTKLEFISGLNDLSEAVEYRYDLEAKDVFTVLGGMYIFKVPWARYFSSPDFLATETRKYPIQLWDYMSFDKHEESVTINIPSGMSIVEVPADKVFEDKHLSYNISYKLSGAKLVVTHKIEVFKDVVAPEDYIAFKEMMNKIAKVDDLSLAFK